MPESLHIPASDGFKLAASLFEPEGPARGIVLVNSATAVPRRFYQQFARHIAGAGWRVLTYDYRGIGDSRPASLRGFEATMRQWGLLDMQGVLDWASAQAGEGPIFMVGHSVGGQMAGALERTERVSGLVTMSAQSGYWGFQGGAQKVVVGFNMFVVFPVLSRLMGYFPWSRFASGEDLPRGVALEWAAWCRNPRYFFGDPTFEEHSRFPSFTAPVLAYSFSDDDWGTRPSVDFLMKHYTGATLERRHVAPVDLGVKRIGHTGVFRTHCRPLWDDVLAWFNAQSSS